MRDTEQRFHGRTVALRAHQDGGLRVHRAARGRLPGFASRELWEFKALYLFVDGIAERLHLGPPREAVLAALGHH